MTKKKYWVIGIILIVVIAAGIRLNDLYGGLWILVPLFSVVGMMIHSFRYQRQLMGARVNERCRAHLNISGIISEIEEERMLQNSLWGKEFDDKNSPYDWMGYIIKYVTGENKLPETTEQFRKQMIQTAALSVAAIESIDRGACKMRPDYEATDGYSLVALLGYEASRGIQWPFDKHQFMAAVGRCSYVCKHILELYHEAHDFTPRHLDVPPAKGN